MTLSHDARRFLQSTIPSLLHLEVLLLLSAEEGRWCSGEGVGRQMRISEESAGRVLEVLAAGNLLDVKIAGSVLYQFAPLDAAVPDILEEISAVHFADREVVEAAIASGRRRPSAAQRFADAFRLRNEKP